MRIVGPAVRWLARRFPEVLWYAETAEPVVALTIDDGPVAGKTEGILDALAETGGRATFFMIGRRVAGNEALVRRALAEGHEAGNHFWAHGPSAALGAAALEDSLRRTERALAALGAFAGTRKWLRPGSGWFTPALLGAARRHGYQVALGSVYPFDPHLRSRRFIEAFIRRNVFPGAIIVLHDGGGRARRTAAVLRVAIPELRDRGYRVATLSELASRARGQTPGSESGVRVPTPTPGSES